MTKVDPFTILYNMNNIEVSRNFGKLREYLKNELYVCRVGDMKSHYNDLYFVIKLINDLGTLKLTLHNNKMSIKDNHGKLW